MREIILINITGQDKPGLTSSLTNILAQYEVTILDIGQAVIHDYLSLGILVEIPAEHSSSSILKDLLFRAHKLGIQIRFSAIDPESYEDWTAQYGQQRRIIRLLGRRLTAVQLAKVATAVADAWEPGRVGIRLSPGAYFNMEGDEKDRAVFEHLLPKLRGLAYVHVGIFDDSMTFDELGGVHATDFLREHYDGTLIGCGSYSPETGAEAIRLGRFDLLALGRPFIANPDLMDKVRNGEPLAGYEAEMLTTLE